MTVMPRATAGIERAAGNAAERKRHHRDRESNGETEVGIARRGFRRGHVQHDIRQRKSSDQFGHNAGKNLHFLRRHRRIAFQETTRVMAATMPPATANRDTAGHPAADNARATRPPA